MYSICIIGIYANEANPKNEPNETGEHRLRCVAYALYSEHRIDNTDPTPIILNCAQPNAVGETEYQVTAGNIVDCTAIYQCSGCELENHCHGKDLASVRVLLYGTVFNDGFQRLRK